MTQRRESCIRPGRFRDHRRTPILRRVVYRLVLPSGRRRAASPALMVNLDPGRSASPGYRRRLNGPGRHNVCGAGHRRRIAAIYASSIQLAQGSAWRCTESSRCRALQGGTGDHRIAVPGRFREHIDAPALHPAVFATAVMLLAVAGIAAALSRRRGRRAKPRSFRYGGGPCCWPRSRRARPADLVYELALLTLAASLNGGGIVATS